MNDGMLSGTCQLVTKHVECCLHVFFGEMAYSLLKCGHTYKLHVHVVAAKDPYCMETYAKINWTGPLNPAVNRMYTIRF